MMLARALRAYEPAKMRAVRRLLKPGGVFLDVGANKGDFTILAASIVGAAGRVVSFEPAPDNFVWLEASISLNGCGNVELHRLALSDEDGITRLYLGRRSGTHSLLPLAENDMGALEVQAKTLDGFLSDAAIDRVDLIKLDVEGFEMHVLRGARATLERTGDVALLIDIHPRLGVDPKEVAGYLGSLGFLLFELESPSPEPITDVARVTELLARRELHMAA
jgi:FkbM family methyltransferase